MKKNVMGIIVAAALVACVAAPAFAFTGIQAGFEAKGHGNDDGIGIGPTNASVNIEASAEGNENSQAGSPPGIMHGEGLKVGIVDRIGKEKENFEVEASGRQEARVEFAKDKDDEKKSMGEFMAAKERLRHAASDSEKAEAREEVRARARETLLAQVNAVLAFMQASADTNANADVNAFFSAEKAKLADANISRQDLVKASEEIREFWREHREEVNGRSLAALNARIAAIDSRAREFYNSISGQIKELQAAGVDVNLLVEAQAKIGNDINALQDASAKVNAQFSAGQLSHEETNKIRGLLRAMATQLQKDLGLVKSLFKAVIQLRQGGSVDAGTSEELRENSHASASESVMAHEEEGLDANASGGGDQ